MGSYVVPYTEAAVGIVRQAINKPAFLPATYPALATIIPTRYFQNIVADVVVEEQHEDRSRISDLPVEQGSVISDNAVDEPQELTLTYGWVTGSSQNTSGSTTFLRGIYTQIIQLKQSRVPFSIFTGKRLYTNMLIDAVSTTTDVNSENSLIVRVHFRQVLIVTTTTFTIPQDKTQVASPQKSVESISQGVKNLGPAVKVLRSNPGGFLQKARIF